MIWKILYRNNSTYLKSGGSYNLVYGKLVYTISFMEPIAEFIQRRTRKDIAEERVTTQVEEQMSTFIPYLWMNTPRQSQSNRLAVRNLDSISPRGTKYKCCKPDL